MSIFFHTPTYVIVKIKTTFPFHSKFCDVTSRQEILKELKSSLSAILHFHVLCDTCLQYIMLSDRHVPVKKVKGVEV